MKDRIPAHISIKREVNSIELKTLTDGRVMMRIPYWKDSKTRGSVTFYFDAGCIGWQIGDPVAKLFKDRLEDAQMNVKRLKDGLP